MEKCEWDIEIVIANCYHFGMKGIYAYKDYKNYMLDYLEHKREHGQNTSLRALSLKASLGPSNYLSLILEGKRKLTIAGALSLGRIFGLQKHELKYFVALVELGRAESEEEKQF